MTEAYRIHFGYSRSKLYPQAVELADLAHGHEISGKGDSVWHTAALTEDQVELMAQLLPIAWKLPGPRVHGADLHTVLVCCASGGEYNYIHASKIERQRVRSAVKLMQKDTGLSLEEVADLLRERYLIPYRQDMERVCDRLGRAGRIDRTDLIYGEIRSLISSGEYGKAVDAYYSVLGDRYCGELTKELIYLKRLGEIPLQGRDLLYFRSVSSRDGLIAANLSEYVACVDEVLASLGDQNLPSPMDILTESAPTMEQLIERLRHCWHGGVYLWDGEFKRDRTRVGLRSFSSRYDWCPEGRLFKRYPDPVQHCRVLEFHPSPGGEGLWTTYSPTFYRTGILDKGLHLNGIEAYRHKAWKERRGKCIREPDFTTLKTTDELVHGNYATHHVRYTGRVHDIEGRRYFEIDLERHMDGCFCHHKDTGEIVGNPFLELVEEVLREAENLLREKHGLPRIGEGWVSETHLFRLVQAIFPDAEQHASPPWLKPQHLDVYVSSLRVAFEYQGRQHFEPVEFFGGEESFKETVKRDRRKLRKCKANDVSLIQWRYDEPLDEPTLTRKLENARVVTGHAASNPEQR